MDKETRILFDKWTKNLSMEKALVKIFNKIRDIPYAVVSGLEKEPLKMFKINKGYCAPKHMLLVSMFRKMGIKCKFIICPFKWSEAEQLTDKLRKLAKKYVGYRGHLAATAFINNKWVIIDATWDKKLERLGFPVNYWDGVSDTKLAVKPTGKLKITENYRPSTKKRSKRSMIFYNELNRWMEKARKREWKR